MTDTLPLAHPYNLARLGNAGDLVHFAADAAARDAIARWAGLLSLERLEARVEIKKHAPDRFGLAFQVTADVTQSCVVTLEPVPGHIAHEFVRELVFVPRQRPAQGQKPEKRESETVLDFSQEEDPEEIDSLHVDLAAPVLEEFVLALEPYPRRPGCGIRPPKPRIRRRPESPFAVLKGLKEGL